ncbi:36233_t:CDS:2 [Gigaspora margarita]|uniref:36233_t:CDS:1 n=1 Tax=Gigaspora margarita TaxID=4874 RepID=A0ABM8W6N9_GIGMA|nr:36233_t:CDS:2 [Gigaspora margarita]
MATIYSSDVTDDFKKLYETKEVLNKPNINALVFEIILKYLYCGIVDFQGQKNEIILELLVAADEFGIQRLINSVQEFLIQNCYKFLRSDPIKILDLVICHNAFVNLKKVFLETLTKNCKDFLRKDPIKILNFIIYHDAFDEFRKTLEKTLRELIQLVRFHQINGEEFMFEIWPYRHLLSDNLIEDILNYNKEVLDDKSLKEIRYNFNLLFRSSRDGRVTNCNYAVYCNNDYGPNFGGGHDLYAPNNSKHWYCSSSSNILSLHYYPIIGIPYSFTISDYEVFQVVKN